MYIYQTMSNNFGYIDIILLGMIAWVIILRLRNILGRKTGHETKIYPDFTEKKFFSNLTNSKFSINDVWNTLIQENNLFGFESKNKFIHVTDIKVYKSLLKNN